MRWRKDWPLLFGVLLIVLAISGGALTCAIFVPRRRRCISSIRQVPTVWSGVSPSSVTLPTTAAAPAADSEQAAPAEQ
jgi:hypothetical protein